MRKKNFILKLGMIVAMLFSFTSALAYSFEADGVYYNIISDGTSVEVTYRDMNYNTYIGEVVIPQTVEYDGKNYTVTEIGERAFYKSTHLTSLSIPPTITKIGRDAFEDANGIRNVYITNLSAWCMIDLVDSDSSPLAQGGSLILNGQSVSSLDEIDSSCTKIGKYAFYGNTNLKDVIIPNSIETVGDRAFQGCSNIDFMEIGRNVISMGDGALKGCTKLSTIKFVDSPLTIKLGRYSYSYNYPYFKDCPLKTVYTGREIEWYFNDMNYQYYYPFKTVTTGIFNVGMIHMTSAFTALLDVYIGPNCHDFSISNEALTNLYVFTNEINRVNIKSANVNLFLIDKTNVPDKLQELTFTKVSNLVDVSNLPNNQDYTYGSFPSLTLNQFTSNVSQMDIHIDNVSINKNVGNYNEGIGVNLSNPLWSVALNIPFSYNIVPAPLTIIANDASKQYGLANPELTCSYFGFKNNETADVLTRLPNVETTATINSSVGTYPIIATGAEAQNYSFNYERGTLTITKANQEIVWNQSFGIVNVGDVIELTATSTSGLPIKYTVTDESIVEVFSQFGKKYIEFLKPGNVSIRANQEGNGNFNEADRISKSVTIASLVKPVKEVILNQTSIDLNEGESYQLIAVIIPSNASNKELKWSSSNTDIATIDENGKIIAVKQGRTIISAKTTDESNITVTCEVTVLKQVSGIVLNVSSASLEEGQTLQLSASVSPETANNKKLEWESSNDNIATVSEDGLVTAKNQGSAIITVATTDGSNLSATCIVEVYEPTILISSIVIDPANITGEIGEAYQLKVEITPDNATEKSISWSSDNSAIASVDSYGLVTLLTNGNAIIKASATDGSGISATCAIIVDQGTVITDIEIDSEEYVKIYNIHGLLVFEGKYSQSNLSPGTYIIISKTNRMKRLVR